MVSNNSKFKITTLSVVFFIFFTGCGSKDISAQRKECKEQGHSFYTKKALNFRTGEYELKGICKT